MVVAVAAAMVEKAYKRGPRARGDLLELPLRLQSLVTLSYGKLQRMYLPLCRLADSNAFSIVTRTCCRCCCRSHEGLDWECLIPACHLFPFILKMFVGDRMDF